MISVIVLVVDVCQRSCDRSTPATVHYGIGMPSTIITLANHSLSATRSEPLPSRASSTRRTVIAERCRTMVKKSCRQHLVAVALKHLQQAIEAIELVTQK
jgi:hypothetical protein